MTCSDFYQSQTCKENRKETAVRQSCVKDAKFKSIQDLLNVSQAYSIVVIDLVVRPKALEVFWLIRYRLGRSGVLDVFLTKRSGNPYHSLTCMYMPSSGCAACA